MSILTDQIKAKCTTIAQNLKKVYDKGFADGKASVKHITFNLSIDWSLMTFCALSGMTWRAFLDSSLSETEYSSFYVSNDIIYFDEKIINARLDDEIVDNGYYSCFYTIGSGTEMFYVNKDTSFAENCNSDLNRGRFYVDDNGYVRTASGKMLLCNEGVNAPYPIQADACYYTECYWLWTPDSDFIVFTVSGAYCTAKRGYTWSEFCNNGDYSNEWYLVAEDNTVKDYWGDETIQLNGVNVKPSDVIVEGAEYETVY